MAITSPLVSVVIPTYCQPRLLLEALESVYAQTLRDYEVIVVDDGSTDDTLEQLHPFAQRHADTLRIITQPNAGTGAARNRGIAEARGKYIALLDHDDLWMPRKLEIQVDFLERRPDCCGVGVPYATSREPDRCVFDIERVADAQGIVDRPIRKLADKNAILMTCSVLMFPREKAKGLRFGIERGAIEDVQFEIGLLACGPFGIAGFNEKEILAIYRVHELNASSQASYFDRGVRELRRLEREGAFGELSPELLSDTRAWLGFLGRAGAVTQLLQGKRLRGWATYLREFVPQLRECRFDFLLGYPLFAMGPRRLVTSWAHRAPRIPTERPPQTGQT